MAWWDSVASLTPVAAWDAAHFSGGQLQDQVGSNAITVHGGEANSYPFYSLYGAGKAWPFNAPIALSGDFVLVGFLMLVSRMQVFYKTSGDNANYFLYQDEGGNIKMRANGTGGVVGSGPAWGTPSFMALVVSPASARVYINGDWVGASFSRSWVPNSVGGIGYVSDVSEYNLDPSERFYAAGLWSGVPTLADLQALEAACRAAIATPAPGAHAPALLRWHSPCSDRWDDPGGYDAQARSIHAARRNIHFGGNGFIAGTVKEKGNPDKPLVRQVLLYSENTNTLVASTWSDAAGNYRFDNLDPTQRYTVISYDYKRLYRAVIADNLVPEKML